MRAELRSHHTVAVSVQHDGLFQVALGAFGVIGLLLAFGCAPPPPAQTPTFNPNGGGFVESTTVEIACDSGGATIRYTTDGSEPTESSAEYTAAMELLETTTVLARAFADGMSPSAIASATFGITATRLVNVSSSGDEAVGGDCSNPAISGDGRYVAFSADDTGLVDGDTNGFRDIFVHARRTGQTARITMGSDGAQPDGASRSPEQSNDGRYVVFESLATNLVDGDTNAATDIFLVDRQAGQTTRVSVASDASQANDRSNDPRITSDGRYIAFSSRATNLVDGDTNDESDIFLHDRQTGQTERVSVSSGGAQGDSGSLYPAVSSDGRYVAFEFWGTNLVDGDTNGMSDILVRDRQTSQTTRVSISSAGQQADEDSFWPCISADGRYVAFESRATTLVDGDTNGTTDVFVHDRQTGQTSRVSVSSAGAEGNGHSYASSISADGRFVAFVSSADNLVSGDTNGARDVFLHDRQSGQTTRLSVSSAGAEADDAAFDPDVSSDGQLIAFRSVATNLIDAGTDRFNDVYVRDRGLWPE